jgi:hypothetical protein
MAKMLDNLMRLTRRKGGASWLDSTRTYRAFHPILARGLAKALAAVAKVPRFDRPSASLRPSPHRKRRVASVPD